MPKISEQKPFKLKKKFLPQNTHTHTKNFLLIKRCNKRSLSLGFCGSITMEGTKLPFNNGNALNLSQVKSQKIKIMREQILRLFLEKPKKTKTNIRVITMFITLTQILKNLKVMKKMEVHLSLNTHTRTQKTFFSSYGAL